MQAWTTVAPSTRCALSRESHCDEQKVWTNAARRLHRNAVKLWMPYRDDGTLPEKSVWSDTTHATKGTWGDLYMGVWTQGTPQVRTLTKEEFKLKCMLATERSQRMHAFRLLGDWVRDHGWSQLANRRKRITHVEFHFHVNRRTGGSNWFIVVRVDRHDRVRVFHHAQGSAWWNRTPIDSDSSCWGKFAKTLHSSLTTFAHHPNIKTSDLRFYDNQLVDGVPKRVLVKNVWPQPQ